MKIRGRKDSFLLPENLEPDKRCLQITVPDDPQWLSNFWGMFWELTYWTRHERDPEKKATTVAAFWKECFFDSIYMSGDCEPGEGGEGMKLRQKPENDCVLQQEQGEGNWIDVFDYSACRPPMGLMELNNFISFQNTMNIAYTEVFNQYDGDVTNLYQFFEYQSDGATDEQRNRALCLSLKNLVDTIFDAAIAVRVEQNQGLLDNLNLSALWSQIAGGGVASWLAIIGLGKAAAVIGVLAAVASGVFAVLAQLSGVDISDLEDEEIREDLVCCLYDELKDTTPQYGAWVTSLINCATPALLGTNLSGVVTDLISDEIVFANFANSWASGIQASTEGILLPECECDPDPDEWEHTFFFKENGHQGPWFDYGIQDNNPAPTGGATQTIPAVYTVGQGVVGQCVATDTSSQQYLAIMVSFPPRRISHTQVWVDYDYTHHGGDPARWGFAIRWNFNNKRTIDLAGMRDNWQGTDILLPSATVGNDNINSIRVALRSGRGGPPNCGGTVIVRKIRIAGNGGNPFI